MSDDNSDSKVTLSRRKALAGMGGIGMAGALGLGGTYAQFTDTEGTDVTFSAGKIDGTLEYSASYNGKEVADDLTNVTVANDEPGIAFDLTDVKPGDYGSITFELTVQNNPAWVASCLGYKNSNENEIVESEQDAEADRGDNYQSGELEENIRLIPFYSPGPNTFFDQDGAPDGDWTAGDMGAYGSGTSAAFWNSREGENDFDDLQPRTVKDAATGASSRNTMVWNEDDGLVVVPGPEGASIEEGCVLLEGNLAGEDVDVSETYDDEQGVSPLQPGDTLSFGYDWHLPYTTGNEAQTDELTIQLGFTFSQVRHSDAPQFQNSFDPGNYTPN